MKHPGPAILEFKQVETVLVNADGVGQRIDNFLLARSRGVPRSHVYQIIRTGQVRVNGGRVRVTHRLCIGDKVRIPPMTVTADGAVRVPDKIINLLEKNIILENSELIALNKPAGIAVHKGSGLHFGVIEAMRQSRSGSTESNDGDSRRNGNDERRLELIHRLDRGTSGCLLIGKGLRNSRELQDFFRQGKVLKHYLALTCGQWKKDRTIKLGLSRNQSSGGERVVRVSSSGKPAVSHFTINQRFSEATLMDVQIETGRTHQIRVHAASEGHAVVGDEKYGGAEENRKFRQTGLKRLYLHSVSLELPMNPPVCIRAEPDTQWQDDLKRLSLE